MHKVVRQVAGVAWRQARNTSGRFCPHLVFKRNTGTTGLIESHTTAAACGIFTDIGRRKANEDAFVVAHVGDSLLLGVFDGHAGAVAADFVAKNIEQHVGDALLPGKSMQQVLEQSVQSVSDALDLHLTSMHEGGQNRSGCTATVALVNATEVCVAQVGDSGAILVEQGEATLLTPCHRPDNLDEYDRIIAAGGEIPTWRSTHVQGMLGMTRALGSLHMRPYGVVPTAHIISHKIDPQTDAALILATDGVLDCLHDKNRYAVIAEAFSQSESVQDVAFDLVQFAAASHSRDNATVIVCPLPSWTLDLEQPEDTVHMFALRSS
eukprot:m.4266 g.4266  ORF g.4266 m.4266 type:complete len:322 (+) comp4447_c0_seq1:204-1169(+)